MFISKQKNKKILRFVSTLVLVCLVFSIFAPFGFGGFSGGRVMAAGSIISESRSDGSRIYWNSNNPNVVITVDSGSSVSITNDKRFMFDFGKEGVVVFYKSATGQINTEIISNDQFNKHFSKNNLTEINTSEGQQTRSLADSKTPTNIYTDSETGTSVTVTGNKSYFGEINGKNYEIRLGDNGNAVVLDENGKMAIVLTKDLPEYFPDYEFPSEFNLPKENSIGFLSDLKNAWKETLGGIRDVASNIQDKLTGSDSQSDLRLNLKSTEIKSSSPSALAKNDDVNVTTRSLGQQEGGDAETGNEVQSGGESSDKISNYFKDKGKSFVGFLKEQKEKLFSSKETEKTGEEISSGGESKSPNAKENAESTQQQSAELASGDASPSFVKENIVNPIKKAYKYFTGEDGNTGSVTTINPETGKETIVSGTVGAPESTVGTRKIYEGVPSSPDSILSKETGAVPGKNEGENFNSPDLNFQGARGYSYGTEGSEYGKPLTQKKYEGEIRITSGIPPESAQSEKIINSTIDAKKTGTELPKFELPDPPRKDISGNPNSQEYSEPASVGSELTTEQIKINDAKFAYQDAMQAYNNAINNKLSDVEKSALLNDMNTKLEEYNSLFYENKRSEVLEVARVVPDKFNDSVDYFSNPQISVTDSPDLWNFYNRLPDGVIPEISSYGGSGIEYRNESINVSNAYEINYGDVINVANLVVGGALACNQGNCEEWATKTVRNAAISYGVNQGMNIATSGASSAALSSASTALLEAEGLSFAASSASTAATTAGLTAASAAIPYGAAIGAVTGAIVGIIDGKDKVGAAAQGATKGAMYGMIMAGSCAAAGVGCAYGAAVIAAMSAVEYVAMPVLEAAVGKSNSKKINEFSNEELQSFLSFSTNQMIGAVKGDPNLSNYGTDKYVPLDKNAGIDEYVTYDGLFENGLLNYALAKKELQNRGIEVDDSSLMDEVEVSMTNAGVAYEKQLINHYLNSPTTQEAGNSEEYWSGALAATKEQISKAGSTLLGREWEVDDAWMSQHPNATLGDWVEMIKATPEGKEKIAKVAAYAKTNSYSNVKTREELIYEEFQSESPDGGKIAFFQPEYNPNPSPPATDDSNAWYNTWELTDPNKQVTDAFQMKFARSPSEEEMRKYSQGDMRANLKAIDELGSGKKEEYSAINSMQSATPLAVTDAEELYIGSVIESAYSSVPDSVSAKVIAPAPDSASQNNSDDSGAWYNQWELTDPNKQVNDAFQMKLGRDATEEERAQYSQGDMRANLKTIDSLGSGAPAPQPAVVEMQPAPQPQPSEAEPAIRSIEEYKEGSPKADVNNDGAVNPSDLGIMMSEYQLMGNPM